MAGTGRIIEIGSFPARRAMPLGLVYGLLNSESVRALHAESLLRQRYAEEADALRQSRERTLHYLADTLHDHVMSELRGVLFTVAALQRRTEPIVSQDADLVFVADSLTQLTQRLRSMLEKAKPVDWSHVGLADALTWLGERFHRMRPEVDIHVDVRQYDEADPAAVKDALYAIGLAALDNVQSHARSDRVKMSLSSAKGHTCLDIRDNGVGFDPDTVSELATDRRHLGLANMRLHAREVGGVLTVHSRSQAGAVVKVCVPRHPTSSSWSQKGEIP